MKNPTAKIILIILVNLIISCKPGSKKSKNNVGNEILAIKYTGDADSVQFKMLEGLNHTLKKDSIAGKFKGSLEIPNLNKAIFTFDISVYRKDSTGQMIELEPNLESIRLNQKRVIEKDHRYLWVGKERADNYRTNEKLFGSLITKNITSKFLEERKLSIYTPNKVSVDIPYVYFTDGSMVKSYAPYIDHLISTNTIKPIKLVGIHSNSLNRHEEYVQVGDYNDLFNTHEKFVFDGVINTMDNEIEDWKGQRYIYGVSNGAAFCMYSALNHPKVFEEIVAFSTTDYISPMAQMINPIEFKFDHYPKFYIGAGKYETSIYDDNLKFLNKMKENSLHYEFKEFISGHDYNVWRIELLEYLEKRFAK
jgi:enterochelin esterase-like enzyme